MAWHLNALAHRPSPGGGSMAAQVSNRDMDTRRIEHMHGALGHPVALGTSTFVLGFITGLFLKDAAKRTYERARRSLGHREHTRTVMYGENLPASLGRREPV